MPVHDTTLCPAAPSWHTAQQRRSLGSSTSMAGAWQVRQQRSRSVFLSTGLVRVLHERAPPAQRAMGRAPKSRRQARTAVGVLSAWPGRKGGGLEQNRGEHSCKLGGNRESGPRGRGPAARPPEQRPQPAPARPRRPPRRAPPRRTPPTHTPPAGAARRCSGSASVAVEQRAAGAGSAARR